MRTKEWTILSQCKSLENKIDNNQVVLESYVSQLADVPSVCLPVLYDCVSVMKRKFIEVIRLKLALVFHCFVQIQGCNWIEKCKKNFKRLIAEFVCIWTHQLLLCYSLQWNCGSIFIWKFVPYSSDEFHQSQKSNDLKKIKMLFKCCK